MRRIQKKAFRWAALVIFGAAFLGAQEDSTLLSSSTNSPLGGQSAAASSAKEHATAPKDAVEPKASREIAQPTVGVAEDKHLDKAPPRKTKGLDLVKMGWSYDCMECHKMLKPQWHRDRPMVEHSDLKLNHGNNRFCLNCHHPLNRNAFVDYDGSEIAESEVVLLCAKCHGPTYRDWEAGAHGRRNGYWNKALGKQTRLTCIQCHDPHDPRYREQHPLGPPRYPERGANPIQNVVSAHP